MFNCVSFSLFKDLVKNYVYKNNEAACAKRPSMCRLLHCPGCFLSVLTSPLPLQLFFLLSFRPVFHGCNSLPPTFRYSHTWKHAHTFSCERCMNGCNVLFTLSVVVYAWVWLCVCYTKKAQQCYRLKLCMITASVIFDLKMCIGPVFILSTPPYMCSVVCEFATGQEPELLIWGELVKCSGYLSLFLIVWFGDSNSKRKLVSKSKML